MKISEYALAEAACSRSEDRQPHRAAVSFFCYYDLMATRSSKGTGKSIKFQIYVWYNEKTRKIQIASNDGDRALSDFNIAVGDDPTKSNGHPTLFRRLKKLLLEKGAPAPP